MWNGTSGGAFYDDAVYRLNKAKEFLQNSPDYRLRYTYMVWCQGENDGDIGTSKDVYYDILEGIVDTLVETEGIKQCFVIRIGENRDNVNKYDDIMNAQTELCIKSANCTLVSTQFADMINRG